MTTQAAEQAKPDLRQARFEAIKAHELALVAYYHNSTEEAESRCVKALEACYETGAVFASGKVSIFISDKERAAIAKARDDEWARLEALEEQAA